MAAENLASNLMRMKNLNMPSVHHWSDLFRLAVVTMLYALSAKFTLAYLMIEGNISILWVPSGIGLAAVLIGGRKYLTAIFVGAMAAYLWMGRPVLPSTLAAIGNVLESLLVYWLLTSQQKENSSPDRVVTNTRNYFRLCAVTALAALLAALMGAMALWLGGAITPAMIPVSMLHGWMGDTLAMVSFTPFILVWRRLPAGWLSRERVLETIVYFAMAFVSGQIIFIGWFKESAGEIALPYLMFVFVAWGALRFGRHGSMLIIVMTILQFLMGTAQGTMFYLMSGTVLWLYMATLTLVGTTLSLTMYERRQAECRLNEAFNETTKALAAERLMVEAQRQFVTMVSHEFRTPLAIIDAANQSLRVLIDQGDVEVSKRVDKIAQAMVRLKTLIDHTLSSERLEMGRLAKQFYPFDLGEWLSEQFMVAQLMAPQHPVTLILDNNLADRTVALFADSHLLSIAWMNLVDNAAKYTPTGSPIQLRAGFDGKTLLLDVADAGPGIPASDLPNLFDKFVRGSQAQGIAGAGLGLYLVRRIAELHGGTVTVVNTEPGCRITLRLKLSEAK